VLETNNGNGIGVVRDGAPQKQDRNCQRVINTCIWS
jgi:hypothetical protein